MTDYDYLTKLDFKPATCKSCGSTVDEIDLFPGGICLECYTDTADAKRPLTAADVRGMWGMDR